MNARLRPLLVLFCLFCSCVATAREARRSSADPIATAIQRAAQDYRQGRQDAAATQLEHAARLIREARSAALAAHLPPAPTGWFAAPRSAETLGASALGTAAGASREYLQGERVLGVRYLADAPAVQAALQAMNTPNFATADGARLLRVGGQPGWLKFDSARRAGRLTLIVAQRVLVTVEGIDVTPELLLSVAESIDMGAMARLSH